MPLDGGLIDTDCHDNQSVGRLRALLRRGYTPATPNTRARVITPALV